ncbi:MAG: hypothetical protein ACRENU_12905, partial [Gemmatimonadaceae bacterium]
MLVSVAVPLPLFNALVYEVPDDLADRVQPGSRVIVPVRGRHELGFVVGEGAGRDGLKPKRILAAPDAEPSVDATLLELCLWIARYYFAPPGMVLRTALPAALLGSELPDPRQKTRRLARVARPLPTL